MKHYGIKAFAIATCSIVLGTAGCYKYEPPAGDFNASSFTERDRTASDEILDTLKTLCLADAQKISLLNNPTYVAAFHSANAARMRYYQSFASYAPQIEANFSLGATNTWNHNKRRYNGADRNNNTANSIGVQASLLLFDGLAREFGVMAAKHSYKSSQALNEDARRQLLYGVAQAYYDILLASANRRIALEDMSFQLKNLRETEIKHQYGAVPLSDVLNFQIQVNSADSGRLTAEYNYSAALYALAALMGYPEGTLPDSITFPDIQYETDTLLLSVDTYLDMALANRPDLKSYREQLKVSQFNLYQTYSAYSPTATAYAGLSANHSNTVTHGDNSTPPVSYGAGVVNYGLQANWVIFNGFYRYNQMREAQANMAVARFQVADSWLTVVNDVRTAYANYDLNIKQANLYSEIRKLVFEQRDLVQAEFDAGQAEIVRLNEAQRNVVSAESTLVQSLANVQKARAQLEAAANINNLGRKAIGVFGVSETQRVLAGGALDSSAAGMGDAAQVEAAVGAEKRTDAEKAVFTPSPEIVGPPAGVTDAQELRKDYSK